MTEYLTRIIDGKTSRSVARQIAECLKGMEGKKVFIRITPANTRSLQQNRYLHALFEIFAKSLVDLTGDTCYDKELVKNMAKTKFLLKDIVHEETGEVIGQYVQETRSLNKEQFYEFTKQVIGWAADKFEIHLPLPNEQMEIEL